MTTVAVVGASGFVGHAVLRALAPSTKLLAISRTPFPTPDGVVHRSADLFSLLQIEQALAGAERALYLVHSMLPARLTQAKFEDMDLLLADNFARAARHVGIKHILYLGGLIPEEDQLSRHLRSRLEVEKALASTGIPVTALRAGLIVGAGGSSFDMMRRLVERLPVMMCPAWTRSMTQPIALCDVVAAIQAWVQNPNPQSGHWDIGGPDQMTYVEMLQRTAAVLKKRRWIFTVPAFSPRLSVFWIELVTGAHRELIRPLVESLRHHMIVRKPAPESELPPATTPFDQALQQALKESKNCESQKPRLQRSDHYTRQRGFVVSIQRLPLPRNRTAQWVAEEYARWLPRLFRLLITVDQPKPGVLHFRCLRWKKNLLCLELSLDRSSPDRSLFYITGGLLSRCPSLATRRAPARLEFRETPDGHSVLASVLNYQPTLPWPLYRLTQAQLHMWVMRRFGAHLRTCSTKVPTATHDA